MTVAITFTCSPQFAADLKAQSRALDISKSKLLRDAFYAHLETMRVKAEKAESA